MYKKLLIISFSALMVTACGGSSSSSSSGSGTNGGNTGGNTGGNNGGNNGGGTVVGGQSGNFGDSAAAENGIAGTFSICPDSTAGSFSSFTQNGDAWCIKRCPSNVSIENDDGDVWGRYNDGGNLLVCRDENVSPGSQINVDIYAPINGCPTGGCPTNSFPQVFVSASAGSELAGNYTCTASVFNQTTQIWETQSSPAPFNLTLNADNSASSSSGNSGTWSFANGVLMIEGGQTFTNVAVGSGSFTSYDSNTAVTRCTTG